MGINKNRVYNNPPLNANDVCYLVRTGTAQDILKAYENNENLFEYSRLNIVLPSDSLIYTNASVLHLAVLRGDDLAEAIQAFAQNLRLRDWLCDTTSQGTRALNLTPLHIAARHNQLASAEILLRNGADVDAVHTAGKQGEVFEKNITALYLAASDNNWDMCELLLFYGADAYAVCGSMDLKTKAITENTPAHWIKHHIHLADANCSKEYKETHPKLFALVSDVVEHRTFWEMSTSLNMHDNNIKGNANTTNRVTFVQGNNNNDNSNSVADTSQNNSNHNKNKKK